MRGALSRNSSLLSVPCQRSSFPLLCVARLVGVGKPKTELDTVLEGIGGMTEADREALLSALRDQPEGKGKKTG